MRRAICAVLIGWLSLGTAMQAVAQEPPGELKPIFVAAVPSFQNFIDDLKYVGGMTNVDPRFKEESAQNFVREVGKILGQVLQKDPIDLEAIKGLDRERPCGMLVVTDGVLIAPLVFLPVSDLPAFLASVENMVGPVNDMGDGVYEVGEGLTSGMVQQVGDWAYLTQVAEHAAWMPEPLDMLGELHTQYDVAIQVHVQNIPEVFRDFAVDLIRTQFLGESGVQNFSQQVGLLPFDLVQRVLTEAELVTCGISIDAEGQKLTSETHIVPLEGSRLATQIEATSETQTAFGGLASFEKPVLKGHLVGPLDSEAVEELSSLLDGYGADVINVLNEAAEFETDEDRQVFTDLSNQLIEQLKASVAEGQVDVGVAIYGDRPPFSMVAAAHVADGKAIEDIFLRLAEFADNDPGIQTVELNAAEHGETTIHSLTLGPSADLQAITKLFGQEVLLGFQANSIWIAQGGNALEDLKRAIDGEPATVQHVQMDARLASVVRMLAETIDDQTQKTVAAVISMNLNSAGGDATTMTVAPTEDGQLRIYSESASGILRTVAVAMPLLMQLSQQGGGGAPF